MTSSLSIASVTAALRDVLMHAFTGIEGAPKVTSVPPTGQAQDDRTSRINVFLYQVSPNPHRRDVSVPTRRSDGTVVQAPAELLDLGYLVTFHGDPESLVPERLLGNTLALLAVNRILTGARVRSALENARPEELQLVLADSSLPGQRPPVSLSLFPLSADALRQLWSSLFAQQAYRLSIALEASTVIVAADVEPRPPLPVQLDGVKVRFDVPRVTAISPGVVIGETLILEGERLGQADLIVRVGDHIVAFERDLNAPERRLLVPLDTAWVAAAGLAPGPVPVQVQVTEDGVRSDRSWFVLRARDLSTEVPEITGITEGVDVGGTLTLAGRGFDRPDMVVDIGDGALRLPAAVGAGEPGALTVVLRASDVATAGLAPGVLAVRVQVGDDGARSRGAWVVLRPTVVDAQVQGAVLNFALRPAPGTTQAVLVEISAAGQTLYVGDAQRSGARFEFVMPTPPTTPVTVDVMVAGAAASTVEVGP